MATQKSKLMRALFVGAAGAAVSVVVGVGAQILTAAYETTLDPVYGIPGYAAVGGMAGGPLLLYALPTLLAAGFRLLKDAGFLALLPWTKKQ